MSGYKGKPKSKTISNIKLVMTKTNRSLEKKALPKKLLLVKVFA